MLAQINSLKTRFLCSCSDVRPHTPRARDDRTPSADATPRARGDRAPPSVVILAARRAARAPPYVLARLILPSCPCPAVRRRPLRVRGERAPPSVVILAARPRCSCPAVRPRTPRARDERISSYVATPRSCGDCVPPSALIPPCARRECFPSFVVVLTFRAPVVFVSPPFVAATHAWRWRFFRIAAAFFPVFVASVSFGRCLRTVIALAVFGGVVCRTMARRAGDYRAGRGCLRRCFVLSFGAHRATSAAAKYSSSFPLSGARTRARKGARRMMDTIDKIYHTSFVIVI